MTDSKEIEPGDVDDESKELEVEPELLEDDDAPPEIPDLSEPATAGSDAEPVIVQTAYKGPPVDPHARSHPPPKPPSRRPSSQKLRAVTPPDAGSPDGQAPQRVIMRPPPAPSSRISDRPAVKAPASPPGTPSDSKPASTKSLQPIRIIRIGGTPSPAPRAESAAPTSYLPPEPGSDRPSPARGSKPPERLTPPRPQSSPDLRAPPVPRVERPQPKQSEPPPEAPRPHPLPSTNGAAARAALDEEVSATTEEQVADEPKLEAEPVAARAPSPVPPTEPEAADADDTEGPDISIELEEEEALEVEPETPRTERKSGDGAIAVTPFTPPAAPPQRPPPRRPAQPVGQSARSAAPANELVGQPARSAAPANEPEEEPGAQVVKAHAEPVGQPARSPAPANELVGQPARSAAPANELVGQSARSAAPAEAAIEPATEPSIEAPEPSEPQTADAEPVGQSARSAAPANEPVGQSARSAAPANEPVGQSARSAAPAIEPAEAAVSEELEEVAPDSDEPVSIEAPEDTSEDDTLEERISLVEAAVEPELSQAARQRPPPAPSARVVQAALEAPTEPKKRRIWWEELFTDDFSRAFSRLSDQQVRREADFIEDALGVAQGGTVLDLACGIGQHAVEMSSRGYSVVGFDLSVPQLALAGELAQERGEKMNFLQGDMREMTFDEMFDGIYCWNTSFGYFEEDKNVAVAQRVFKALRPGGSFLLDVANRDFVVEQQPSSVWFEGDGCVCMDDMSVDFITSRLRVKRTMMLDDGRTQECFYSIRIYGLNELGKLLHSIGFKVLEASGHHIMPGVFLGATSPRVIILAQKPE